MTALRLQSTSTAAVSTTTTATTALLVAFLLLLTVATTVPTTSAFVAPFSKRGVAFASSSSSSRLDYSTSNNNQNNNNQNQNNNNKALDDDDWRQFRAKLVLKEHGIDRATKKQHQQWAYQQDLIETGTLLVHSGDTITDDGSYIDSTTSQLLLDRPYLYKSVMLVVDTNDDETTCLLLNRPANVTLSETNFTAFLLYGGPHNSFHHSNNEQRIYCLHRKSDCRDVSEEIMSGLFLSSLEDAKLLHSQGRAAPADFLYISGYETVETAAMDRSVGSGIWKSITTDSLTLQQGLEPNLHANLLAWTGSPPNRRSSSSSMEEELLKEWTQTCLYRKDSAAAPEAPPQQSEPQQPPREIQAGDLLRASSADHAFLFDHQEFHKSLVLILEADDETAVGALLSYPTVEQNSLVDLPVRYGGSDALDDDVYCLHYSHDVAGSSKVGSNSNFYQCSLEHASRAMERGLARRDEFLVVRGKVAFPKQNAALDVVPPDQSHVIWGTLSKQEALSPFSLTENVNVARRAWKEAGGAVGAEKLSELGLAAVQKWVSSHLLTAAAVSNDEDDEDDDDDDDYSHYPKDNYYRP